MLITKKKGWYALQLCEYIIDAIFFAKDTFSKKILYQIIKYATDAYDDKKSFKKLYDLLEEFIKGDIELEILRTEMTEQFNDNDPVLYLINKL